jgi:hypothetical protein
MLDWSSEEYLAGKMQHSAALAALLS